MGKTSEITIDLSYLSLEGNVLDIGYQGKGAIYRALTERSVPDFLLETAAALDTKLEADDFNWVYGHPNSLPFEDKSFDVMTSFFAFAYIDRNRSRMKLIREIARTLKNEGKILIWDLNIKDLTISIKKNINVKLSEDRYVDINMDFLRWPGNFGADTMLPVVERYFVIKDKYEFDDYFYIEAYKKDDFN
ncbi:putative methyltransferase YcgJ [Oxobacter pfennigii]|uniref:Putative methyltransferase YcgJ n=1 Tax=Oxobacter pfennigii TaxID=36849 RepID=A0A0P8YAZ7_9CLOT|nr:methyltransferase domain-containing protein [Oxobacter pfennigii]KPU44212.1 putative methyltransferase YcgJ [Oxobacter pfennigii]